MTAWLKTRKAGIEVIPKQNDPTPVLRPSRATTVGEKQEMKRRKMQNKGQDGKEKKMKRDLQDLQAHAAAEGYATHFALAALSTLDTPALNQALGCAGWRSRSR